MSKSPEARRPAPRAPASAPGRGGAWSAALAGSPRQLRQAARLGLVQRMPWDEVGRLGPARVADLIEDSTARGGHAGERHIYIGWSGLMARGIEEASAFGDEDQALEVIASVLGEHWGEVEDHAEARPNAPKKFAWTRRDPDIEVLAYEQVVSSAKGQAGGTLGAEVVVVLRYVPVPGGTGEVVLTTAYPIALRSEDFFHKRREKHELERHRERARAYDKKASASFEKYLDSV